MTTFLDTSAVLALLDEGHLSHKWAVAEFIKHTIDGPAIVCDIVYCEVSVGMKSKDDVDTAIKQLGLERINCRDEALFRAGKAYKEYKEHRKGPKLGVMPDFIIGAVAEVEESVLLTANPKDFASYFPNIKIVSPTMKGHSDF